MTGAPMPHALAFLVDEELLALTRAVGELRRRNLAVASLTVGPGARPGEARVTVLVDTDPASAEMAVRKLEKVSGVRAASHFPVADARAREFALCRVRARPDHGAALREVCTRFQATVLDERAGDTIVELASDPSAVLDFVRALEPFGIVELARSGPMALAHAPPAAPTAPPVTP